MTTALPPAAGMIIGDMKMQTATGMVLRPRGAGTRLRASRLIHALVGLALLYGYCLIYGVSVWIPIGEAGLCIVILAAQITFRQRAVILLDGGRIVYRGLPGMRSEVDGAEVAGAAVRYFGGTVRGTPDGAFVIFSAEGQALLVLRLSVWVEDDLAGLVESLGRRLSLTRRKSSLKAFRQEFPGRQGRLIRYPWAVGVLAVVALVAALAPGMLVTLVSRG